jgi:hypothetical protein
VGITGISHASLGFFILFCFVFWSKQVNVAIDANVDKFNIFKKW